MAKPKESFNKKEKEKKKLKQRQEKREKMEERKANVKKGKSLEDMMAYIDEYGNITDTPPPGNGQKKVYNLEDIQIGVPPREEESNEPRKGQVVFFNHEKGFGFITDAKSGERIFIHVNNLSEPLDEGNMVEFEVENGPRGLSAVNVKKIV
ncbi:MAG: cold shock domain-containing protein [Chitinophagaceae bacterium]|nr:cold shock domain-containing protein [Chitinophagaceae bacterium]